MKSKPMPGWDGKQANFENDRLIIDGYQVMMDWETPYMHRMAEMLHAHTAGSILEVGFGMGISATKLQQLGVARHTILEPHPEVYKNAVAWRNKHPRADIELIKDYWQNCRTTLPRFDGIFFDTYSPTIEEADRKRFDFFETASKHLLRDGGGLTFYYMKKNLEYVYQDELLKHFRKIEIEAQSVVSPPDCEYATIGAYALCILAVK